ncbi:YoaK family protein [Mycolicibacterium sp. XJ1819]
MTFANRTIQQPTTMLAVLTMTTGMVEAVSFVGLGFVFTAMMTGNLLFIGFGMVHTTQEVSMAGSSVALLAFMAGAAAGNRVNSELVGRLAGRWLAPAVCGEALVILAAALAAVGVASRPDHLSARHLVVIAVLATAMGWRNATIRRVAMPDMLTTLVTGSLTAVLMGPFRGPVLWRAASVVAIVVGAVIGTLLLWLNPTAALLAVAGIELCVATLSRGIEVKT